MSAKKIALDLSINIKKGDLTLEELNEQLNNAKEQMEEIGDDGSDGFRALGQVVKDAESDIDSLNKKIKDSKKGLEKQTEAQKEATKETGGFKNSVKAVGTAFKALGIGLVVAALKFLFDALSQNQKVMNVVNTVMETISIVMAKVVGTITDVVTKVSESSNGFEGLKNVVMGLLTLAITPLKLAFYGISLGVQQAQLAWETSFFGDDDPATVKRLTESIKETKESLIEVGKDAIESGISIGENLGKAAKEIGGVVGGAIDGISKISVRGAIEQAKTNVALNNSAQIAAAQQGLLVEQYDRLAEKQRQIRDEERNSIADRMKANVELGVVLEKQEKAMLAQADLQVAAAQAQVNKNKNTETETALIEALANKAGVLAAVEGFRSEQKVNELGLDREMLEMNAALGQSDADLAYARAKFNAEQITDKVKSLEALRALEEIRMQDEMLRLEGIVELAKQGTQAEADALIALDAFREESRQANREADNAISEEEQKLAGDRKKRDKDNLEALKQQAEALMNNLVKLKLASSKAEEDRLQDILKNTEEGTEAREKAEKALEKQKEKSFKMEQIAAIGRVLIDTAQGSIKAYTSQLIPGDPTSLIRGAIAASLVAASGLAQVATIKKQKFYGSGDSSISPTATPTLGGGDVGTQPRGFTSPTNNIEQPTTKVIVTETDIRSVTRNVDGVYSRAVVVQ